MDYQFATENYAYDSETGLLTNKKSGRGRGKVGEVAGSKNKAGYRVIGIGGKQYRDSSIAVLIMTGHAPEKNVIHVNGDKSDLRWENLMFTLVGPPAPAPVVGWWGRVRSWVGRAW